jgi:hypothetical protein
MNAMSDTPISTEPKPRFEIALVQGAKGETCCVEQDFARQALRPQFDFSLARIARLAAHKCRLAGARNLPSAMGRGD